MVLLYHVLRGKGMGIAPLFAPLDGIDFALFLCYSFDKGEALA